MLTTLNGKEAIVVRNSDQQLNDARNIANNAYALNEVARHFKATLVGYAAQEPQWRGLAISVADSRTTSLLNFRLVTVHGEIEVIFDHAFHFGRLVGRYRFFAVTDTPLAKMEVREIWAMLFNDNYCATWEPKEDFRWHFTPGHRDVPDGVSRLVQILLCRIQSGLDQYGST